MKTLKSLLTATMFFVLCIAQAQNPWEKYGYTPPKALTLSNGQYEEFFTNDTIVQIGSVMFNTVTNEVVAFLETDTVYSEATLKPEVISRFLSPDPLEKQFPQLTPYQFASNTPIWASDLDGLEARIYTDLTRGGHTFLSVIDDKGVKNVYSYGKYKEGGVLVHLKGETADKYISKEFKDYSPNFKVYEVSKDKVDKQKIIEHFDEITKGNPSAEGKKGEPIVDDALKSKGSSAVKYDSYDLFAPFLGGQNCVTCASKGLEAGGSDVLKGTTAPLDASKALKDLSNLQKGGLNTGVKDVTEDEKKSVEPK